MINLEQTEDEVGQARKALQEGGDGNIEFAKSVLDDVLDVLEETNQQQGLEGELITDVYEMTDGQASREGWTRSRFRPPVILLSDGTTIYPAQDSEATVLVQCLVLTMMDRRSSSRQ
jgi:hypothetical protein